MLKKRKRLCTVIITIWENIDTCAENCICATSLYLLSVLTQSFNIINERGINALGHIREVVDGLNSAYKRFIFQLMSTVQLPGINRFDTQMELYAATQNTYVVLVLEFQKHLSNASPNQGI